MAYSTGTASSMADLLFALTNAGTAGGWAWADSILSSGDCFVKLTAFSDKIEALVGLGKSGATITTPAAASTYLQQSLTADTITFPITYHIFVHPTEIYLHINFRTSLYTTLAFGQSPLAGMPGKGVWICGTIFYSGVSTIYWDADGVIYIPGANYARTGLFISRNMDTTSAGEYVHHGLTGWSGVTPNDPRSRGGIRQLTVMDNPSTNWNGQALLCPIQPHIDRGSSKVSIVADLLHARHVRVDNFEAGDTITLGSDQWKVFPVYKKDASNRSPGNVPHSGTYGYAFRV